MPFLLVSFVVHENNPTITQIKDSDPMLILSWVDTLFHRPTMIKHRVIACLLLAHNYLKLDIVFMVRCGLPECWFKRLIRRQQLQNRFSKQYPRAVVPVRGWITETRHNAVVLSVNGEET